MARPPRELPPWMEDDQRGGPPTPEEREERFQRMAQRMQERAAEQRSNFVERAELDSDQATRFDVLVAAMNMRLREQVKGWQAEAELGELPRAELRARVMNEMSSVMVLTYDELDRTMPAAWREEAGPDFNLYTFVDPQVMREARPFIGRGGFGRPPRSDGDGPAPAPPTNSR